MQLIKYYAKLR